MSVEIESVFKPLPPQWAFMQSRAKIRAYGGAMGGGKSRCLCELAFDLMLDHEGIDIVIARQSHVSIIDSTKKTFVEQVLPPELVARSKESGGEDYIQLKNKSTVHFIGLDDPGRQFSREIGFAIFDEAHQINEAAVVLINTRLRQRCKTCVKSHERDCNHFPHGMALAFNPENPGHWLYKWFIEGATPTDFGYVKEELYPKDAVRPIGDAEFFLARATENVYLPPNYVDEQLGGLPELLRKRYLDGEWLYVSGASFFDTEALTEYASRLEAPAWICNTRGALSGTDPHDRIRLEKVSKGTAAPWWVWGPPVRARVTEERDLPAHRYIVTIDVSSGTANDYSAIQVLDVEAFAQVAEFQGKLDMDLLAEEAFRAAVIYNGALLAPEITGGWGFSVAQKLEKLLAAYKGPKGAKPRLYTRRVEDRLKKRWTDRIGWDTTTKTRAGMLDTLEEVIREREFQLRSHRCHSELVSFVWPAQKDQSGPYKGVPQAQPGANDDLVVALAMAVQLAANQPRELRRAKPRRHEPQFAVTGY